VLESVVTAAGQVDWLSMNPDQTQVRFTPRREKTFNLTIGRRVGDQVRAIAILGISGVPNEDVKITTSPELSFIHFNNPGTARKVEVKTFMSNPKGNQLSKHFDTINLASKGELKAEVQNWETLDINLHT
jgi:hypothetical protein